MEREKVKLKLDCNCGNTWIYSGNSQRYAKCPKCRSRKNIDKILEKNKNVK